MVPLIGAVMRTNTWGLAVWAIFLSPSVFVSKPEPEKVRSVLPTSDVAVKETVRDSINQEVQYKSQLLLLPIKQRSQLLIYLKKLVWESNETV